MSTQKIYSIRDSKGEFYNPPFFAKTHGEAERNFHTLANNDQTTVGQFPTDFDLYHIGEFDPQSGIIKPLATPSHVVKAVNLVKPKSLSPVQ